MKQFPYFMPAKFEGRNNEGFWVTVDLMSACPFHDYAIFT